ncbi:MAG: hypothetical protein LC748_01820 [Thermomicrobia bacterium]|nr:hypothetical protein [Thermomicrobia bacterium]
MGASPTTAIPTLAPTTTVAPTTVPAATPTAVEITRPTGVPTATAGAPLVPTLRAITTVPGSIVAPGGPTGSGCGTVQMRGPTTVGGAAAAQAETCFWQAYQQCRTTGTELTVTEMGVDTFATRAFRLDGASGGCIIRVAEELQIIPRGRIAKAYPCASLTRDAGGALHFLSCGTEGDLIVPPPAGP